MRRETHSPGPQTWDFETIRRWATDRAEDWGSTDGSDRFALDGLDPVGPLRVEMFGIFFSLGLRAMGLASDLDRRGPTAWLKRRGLDRAIRAWSMRLDPRGARPTSGPIDLAVVSEMATPSALLGPAAVVGAGATGRSLALVADPRALTFWKRRGVPVRCLLLSPGAERRVLARASGQAREAWAAFEADGPTFRIGPHDLTAEALPLIRRFVRQSLPWLHVERAAIDEALQDAPKAILLASDQHRVGSLVATEARARGIPTAVLQHGLPQHEVGYLPIAADRILTWSAQSSAWFAAGGADPVRLAIVGNPAFDAYSPITMERHPNKALDLNVLLALTPATRATNGIVTTRALEAVTALPGARLTVKLHPGDGEWGYVRELIRTHAERARVEVRHREPLRPLIQAADVVWLHRSSVALESLAARVPIVVVGADSPSTADLELRGLMLPVAGSGADLAAQSAALLDPTERIVYFNSRPILDFVGPADGQSAIRARAAVLDLADRMGASA